MDKKELLQYIDDKRVAVIRKIFWPIFAPLRRRRLNNDDFSIISNNCLGGVIYLYYHMKKTSPTAGGYFYADDYIKFLSNLKYYTSLDIKMIKAEESKHYDDLKKNKRSDMPVGVLDDIEFVFVHYLDPQEAYNSWMNRAKRINFDNLIVTFCYQYQCNDDLIYKFAEMPQYNKKMIIAAKPFEGIDWVNVVKGNSDGSVENHLTDWVRKFNITKLINK